MTVRTYFLDVKTNSLYTTHSGLPLKFVDGCNKTDSLSLTVKYEPFRSLCATCMKKPFKMALRMLT